MSDAGREPVAFASGAVGSIAAALFLVGFVPAFGDTYGYFLDELYYLACAKRLAWGYVDHPPLAPWILRMQIELLGQSIPSLRLIPALAGAATVLLTGWMAYRMGGGRFAQALAALSLAVAPIPVILFGIFSMNAFEILLWTVACWLLLEIGRSGDGRLWVALGIVVGLAFENKHTSLLLAAGIAAGTLLTPLRRHLRERWLWLGVGTAAVLMAPNLAWQAVNGWPSLEFYRNLASESNLPVTPLEVLLGQVVIHPAAFPVWAAGLVFLFSARGRPHRALGWAFLTLLLIFCISEASRPDRIQGVFPVVFAAGGVALERANRWIRVAVPAFLVAVAVSIAPLLLPFPPDFMASHPLAAGTNDSRREVGPAPIPLPFSHRLGSPEFVLAVARVFNGLDAEERRQAVVLAGDFAHAGAIERYGPDHSLPPVFSPHNNYYLWPPEPGLQPPVVIAIGLDDALLHREFRELEEAAVFRCEYCMGWRDELPITIARFPRRTLAEMWPEMKRIGLPTRKFLMLAAETEPSKGAAP